MNRNEIIKKLIAEGFTEKTLANMSDKSISLLAKRIIGEQAMTTFKKGSVVIPKATANPVEVKKMTDTGVNVELREEEKETKESARTFANQNRPNMPQGTKLKAGRRFDKKVGRPFSKEEVTKVDATTKPYKTIKKVDLKEEEPLEEKKGEKWIQKAIKKPGSLKKSLGVGKDETIPASKLNAAAKKGDKIGQRARLAKTLKKLNETKEVQEWVEGLIKENYHSLTTKNEIMELIKTKLNEQAAAPGIAEPTTKPTTKPGKPGKSPYPDPWQPPTENPVPDPGPKFEEGGEMPEFLKYDNIVSSLNEEHIKRLTSLVMSQLKKKVNEQAFNDAGEPLMTHQQFRDYSEPSEPDNDEHILNIEKNENKITDFNHINWKALYDILKFNEEIYDKIQENGGIDRKKHMLLVSKLTLKSDLIGDDDESGLISDSDFNLLYDSNIIGWDTGGVYFSDSKDMDYDTFIAKVKELWESTKHNINK